MTTPKTWPALEPQPLDELPGTAFYFHTSDAKAAAKASGIHRIRDLLEALAGFDIDAIEKSLPHGLHNADGSGWQGGIDAVPLPIAELGYRLADALHRRLTGAPLIIDEEGPAAAEEAPSEASANDGDWKNDVL